MPNLFEISPTASRWQRLLLRMAARRTWHWKGVMLWLVQRPFLRFLPVPLPVVTNAEEWKTQLKDMVRRKVWPKRWLPKAQEVMSLLHLQEAQTLRNRMGLEEAFMEDEAVMFGIKALKKPPRARKQAALVQATHQAIAELDGRKEELARELLGPRGGMPRNKADLVKLAVLLNVTVDPKDTNDQLKAKCKPMVDVLMGKALGSSPERSKGSAEGSDLKGPMTGSKAMEVSAPTGPTAQAPTLSHLQVPWGLPMNPDGQVHFDHFNPQTRSVQEGWVLTPQFYQLNETDDQML